MPAQREYTCSSYGSSSFLPASPLALCLPGFSEDSMHKWGIPKTDVWQDLAAQQCVLRQEAQETLPGELGQIWCKTYFLSIPISLLLALGPNTGNTAGRCSKNKEILESSGDCLDTGQQRTVGGECEGVRRSTASDRKAYIQRWCISSYPAPWWAKCSPHLALF